MRRRPQAGGRAGDRAAAAANGRRLTRGAGGNAPARRTDLRDATATRAGDHREDGMDEIAPHIYRWTAPHPEYRSSVEEVVSYALVDGEAPRARRPAAAGGEGRAAALLAELDGMAGEARRLELLVTIPYHTRSVETLYERYAAHRADAASGGTPACSKRLTRGPPLEVIPQSAAGEAAEIADGAVAGLHHRQAAAQRVPAVLPRAARRGLRRRRRRRAGRPALLEPELGHRRGLVPRRVRAHAARRSPSRTSSTSSSRTGRPC